MKMNKKQIKYKDYKLIVSGEFFKKVLHGNSYQMTINKIIKYPQTTKCMDNH